MRNDYFKHGDHNAICYVCGFERKSSEMLLRWDGVYVCREDWEPRHPQDFVRGEPEEQPPMWTQPEPPDQFVGAAITPLTNIVVGTPSIFVNGALMTPGTDYTIVLPQGNITFTVAPPKAQVIAWTGTWLDNASVRTSYTQYPLYTGNGFQTAFTIYGVN